MAKATIAPGSAPPLPDIIFLLFCICMHGNWEKEDLIFYFILFIYFYLFIFCFEGHQELVCDTAPGVSEHWNSVWGHWNFAFVRVCKHFH